MAGAEVEKTGEAAAADRAAALNLDGMQQALRIGHAGVVVRFLGGSVLVGNRLRGSGCLRRVAALPRLVVRIRAAALRNILFLLNLIALGIGRCSVSLLLQVMEFQRTEFTAVDEQGADHDALRFDRAALRKAEASYDHRGKNQNRSQSITSESNLTRGFWKTLVTFHISPQGTYIVNTRLMQLQDQSFN